jgi:iron(III) transport system substrate-binding protein
VIDQVDPVIESRLSGVTVEWLQSGSEKIATRLDAELAAGQTSADLVMTSDPLWYARKKRDGHLEPYAPLRALAMHRDFVDPDGAFVTSRLSTMVIAYNSRLVQEPDAPRSFRELFSERWRGKVTIPDPLGSGTAFTTLMFLVDAFGEEIIDRMKAVETVASGGNSAALSRLEAGEHQVGFVLLENVLAARAKGSPIAFAVPEEGPVLIPGPVAALTLSRNPAAARAVYDVLLSPEVQTLIAAGDMHSPFEAVAPPAGAPTLEKLLAGRFRWTREFIDTASARSEHIQRRFAEVMGGH